MLAVQQDFFGGKVWLAERFCDFGEVQQGAAQQEIAQRMQRNFIEEQLKEAKKKIEVKIDEKALENLGGMAAPSGENQEQKPAAPAK